MNYWQIYGYPDKLNAFIKISPPYTTEATGGAGWCVSHSLERCSQLTIPKIWYRAYQLLHLPIQNAGGGARPLLMHKAASTSDRRKQLRVEKMRQLCQISAKQPQSELLGWFYFCKKQTSGCLKKKRQNEKGVHLQKGSIYIQKCSILYSKIKNTEYPESEKTHQNELLTPNS